MTSFLSFPVFRVEADGVALNPSGACTLLSAALTSGLSLSSCVAFGASSIVLW